MLSKKDKSENSPPLPKTSGVTFHRVLENNKINMANTISDRLFAVRDMRDDMFLLLHRLKSDGSPENIKSIVRAEYETRFNELNDEYQRLLSHDSKG